MNKVVLFIIGFLTFLSLNACDSRVDKINVKLQELCSEPIKFNTHDFVVVCNNPTYKICVDSVEFKYVCFLDSSECTSCALKDAYRWNDYISMFESNSKQISFLYVLSTKPSRDVMLQIRESGFCQNIYIDTCGVFAENNPHIPNNMMFHTFLLDKNNNVVLVGNPIKNEKIRKRFIEIVNRYTSI